MNNNKLAVIASILIIIVAFSVLALGYVFGAAIATAVGFKYYPLFFILVVVLTTVSNILKK